MRELINEYGRSMLAAVAFLVVVALAISTPILGTKGLLSATVNSAPITGSAATGLKEADAVKQANSTDLTIVQPDSDSYSVKRNTEIPLNSLLLTSNEKATGTKDTSITYSLISALDENKDNCLERGTIVYNKKTHKIKFNKPGFYSLTVRASKNGSPLEKYSFGLYVE